MKQKSFLLRDFVWQNSIWIGKKTDKHFNFQIITSADVERCLKEIKRLKSTGLHDILPCLLKDYASVISLPLAHITNLSFSICIFPSVTVKTPNNTTRVAIAVSDNQLNSNSNHVLIILFNH